VSSASVAADNVSMDTVPPTKQQFNNLKLHLAAFHQYVSTREKTHNSLERQLNSLRTQLHGDKRKRPEDVPTATTATKTEMDELLACTALSLISRQDDRSFNSMGSHTTRYRRQSLYYPEQQSSSSSSESEEEMPMRNTPPTRRRGNNISGFLIPYIDEDAEANSVSSSSDDYSEGEKKPKKQKKQQSRKISSPDLDKDPSRPKKSRKKFSDETVKRLKKWILEHRHRPYPSEEEKLLLCHETGLTTVQLNNWFTNARRRLLKRVEASGGADIVDFEDTAVGH
jgi:hypothetical protein